MDIDHIIKELKFERDRIDAAISALAGNKAGNGRRDRRRNVTAKTGIQGGRRRLSAATRKRISVAAKARWAKAKKAGRNSL